MNRFVLIAMASVALLGTTLGLAQAADFPERPVRLIVPFAPGGGLDGAMRVVQPEVTRRLGQQLIIENKAGAGGALGAEFVSRSAPDGYTLLVYASTATIDPSFRPNLPYSFSRDFEPVSMVERTPLFIVANPNFPPKTVAELIALAKQQPGKIKYGSSGVGAIAHLAVELLKSQAGIEMTHIPYDGSGPATAAVVGGEVQFFVQSALQIKELASAGKLRVIAVTTRERSSIFPDVPTVGESGLPGYEVDSWVSIFAPKGTPGAVIATLQKAFSDAARTPATAKVLTDNGMQAVGGTADELRAQIAAEIPMWAKLIKEGGIKLAP